jgi:hypothetical protein
MFERFTDRARRVIVLAQEEARMLDHSYIGTEHLLLGLVHEEDGAAAHALVDLGVSLDAVRERVESIVGRGQQAPSGHIPFTPRAKKVLELSLRESIQLGHQYIGTEHILLGLVREGQSDSEGAAIQALTELELTPDKVRQAVVRLVRDRRREAMSGALGGSESIEFRLKRIERRLGISASSTLAALDEQIAQIRREKETAIDDADFERAATLRENEKLLLRESALAAETLEQDVTPVLDELADARAEITRLTELLREHGVDPGKTEGKAKGKTEGKAEGKTEGDQADEG